MIDRDYRRTIDVCADDCDLFVDGMYLSAYGAYAVSAFRRRRKKVLMTADGGIARNRGFLINGIMSFLMKRHDHFLSSSQVTDRYFRFYGVDPDRISHYRFTSLTGKDIAENRELRKEKETYRKELKLQEEFILLSVGRPIRVKGFDLLLEAYMKLSVKDRIGLYIVGGQPQQQIRNIVHEKHLDHVHFVDVLPSKELKKYYAAADASIICSRGDVWGLVVNESLSFGLPMISSDMCVAGVHYGEKCGNPIVCGLNDTDAYARAIALLYENKTERERLSASAFAVIEADTIENSALDVIDVLSSAIMER
jgi:glycosyltransferase involved in cell wall biosynthesis